MGMYKRKMDPEQEKKRKEKHRHQTQMTHRGIKTVINKNENARMTARNLLRNKRKFDVQHFKMVFMVKMGK